MAKWGQAFDMKVLGFDPVLPAASFKELNIQKADLDKIWPNVRIYTNGPHLGAGGAGVVD